jgi:hypothetical protein
MSREVRNGLIHDRPAASEIRNATVVDCLEGILDVATGLSRQDTVELVAAFKREHRTNQQTFIREVVIPILEDLAGLPEGHYDLRNEGAVEFARVALRAREEARVGLPLV